ncbi:DUF1761 domain-containing protein [Phenylobacterium sp. Root700]|uniref:DUF1761 domain-containing protein n=1 Tax=Phenylobacterium sp. Root700 TaxID=1736591 RepID=UPI0007019784|nr:DUF1761 domain-containing protein [Phenylobacterium sp. Root700]KRB41313.1 hypothetical protein ASE02_05980 [Phenylobacterium sp. Root700]
MLRRINWIAVVVAFVLLEILGFLWYGPLFGARWMAEQGTPPDPKSEQFALGVGALVTILTVLGLAWLLRRLGATSLQAGLSAAFAAWVFFNFTTMALDYLFMGQTVVFVAINMGYQLVSYLIAGAVLGLIRPKTTAP